jgi:2-polyprenyl-3-methyl-5-hydroxy-6-metoxy-1,4-benzoquinol methylase
MNKQTGMTPERFTADYQGQAPWDVSEPQQYFVEAFSRELPVSPVLDVGCGSGALSLFTAGLGCDVLGVDFSPAAIEIATAKARANGIGVSFQVCNAFKLGELGKKFNTVMDCCFFHTLDDQAREEYARTLHEAMAPGGKLFMLNYAVELPASDAPRKILKEDILTTFQQGWTVLECGLSTAAVNFMAGDIPATYACIQRTA